jgi:adenosylcobyric acid synthase
MLGRAIRDPHGVESSAPEVAGLGLVAASTDLTLEKRTRAVSATTTHGVQFGGYEIHLGVTAHENPSSATPFARVADGGDEGIRGEGIVGTYLHGAFEHPGVCAEVFGIPAPAARSKAEQYRKLGIWFEEHGRHLDELGLA